MKSILQLIGLLLMVSCAQKSNFSGSVDNSTPSENAIIAAAPEPSVDTASSNCIEGDRVVAPWTGPIKDCLNAGKTWHFENKICVDMPKAAFTCDWTTVQGKLKELNLLTETLQKDAAAGAKLVSCGQSADGNRIAVQWLKLVNGSACQKIQEGAGITTGCYTHYVGQDAPAPATSDAERRQRVNECLKGL